MAKKSECDVALEMYQSVMQTDKKQKKLKSSTFWGLFYVKRRTETIVERVAGILDNQGLKVTVTAGATFGKEGEADWIILTQKLIPPIEPQPSLIPSEWPPLDWFKTMQSQNFESEREVETFFIAPLLEKLGYKYEDIFIGCPVEMFKGVQRTIAEADYVLFDGPGREIKNVLLVVETKKRGKGITVDHIGQTKSYAQELFPACYVVSDGQQIIVFLFNGMLCPDERVMDFDRLELHDKWGDLYNYVSKEATIKRKLWMSERISKPKAGV